MEKIPFKRIITLIDSMSLHCAEVIRSLGFPTRYRSKTLDCFLFGIKKAQKKDKKRIATLLLPLQKSTSFEIFIAGSELHLKSNIF